MVRSESPSRFSVVRRGRAGGDPDPTVVWVRAEHDVTTNCSVAAAITRAARLNDVPLLLDLSAVTFMDASTIGAIVGARNRLRTRGLSLELCAPSRHALRVLELCGLEHLIDHPARTTDAAAALRTWVDIPPREPATRIAHEAARLTARPTVGQAAECSVGERHPTRAALTVEANRGGP